MFRSKESERFWQLLEALDAPVTGWNQLEFIFFSGAPQNTENEVDDRNFQEF